MSRVSLVGFLLFLSSISRLSVAEPAGESRREEARERFNRGIHLFDNGDNGGALAEFKRAHDLIPNRLVLFNIGLVYAAMDRPVEAVEALTGVLTDPGNWKPEELAKARQVLAIQEKLIGSIDVVSTVPMDVAVDGIQIGRTPLAKPVPVASGAHLIEFTAPGFVPLRKEVFVASGINAKVAIEPQPTERQFAHISVTCSVPGVQVLVDGAPAGKTPLPASLSVQPGTRRIELSRPGYIAQSREIPLSDGARGEVAFDLKEDPGASPSHRGTLKLDHNEDGLLAFWIDGQSRGAYHAEMTLPAGAHRLRMEQAGFEPLERDILVPAASQLIVKAALRPTIETRQAYHSHVHSFRNWSYGSLIGGAVLAGAAIGMATWSNGKLPGAKQTLTQVQSDTVRFAGGPCDYSLALSNEQISQCKNRMSNAQNDVSLYKNLRTVGIVSAAAGAAILGTGIVLLWLSPDPNKYEEQGGRELSLSPRWHPLISVDRYACAAWLVGNF